MQLTQLPNNHTMKQRRAKKQLNKQTQCKSMKLLQLFSHVGGYPGTKTSLYFQKNKTYVLLMNKRKSVSNRPCSTCKRCGRFGPTAFYLVSPVEPPNTAPSQSTSAISFHFSTKSEFSIHEIPPHFGSVVIFIIEIVI